MEKTRENRKIAIKISHLTKKFGSLAAVVDVNLEIKSGEIFSLIGPNGAGKTTLMKCLVGLLSPDGGMCNILGVDVYRDSLEAKKLFAYVPDDPVAYGYLSGMEFLALSGNLRGISPPSKLKKRIDELIKYFPLEDIILRPMSSYSRGNRQKLAFLSAILSSPPVLFIDEPIAGLDPESILTFGRVLKNYSSAGNTVFFISHSLSFAKDFADKVSLMKEGGIVKTSFMKDVRSLEDFSGIR
ncbi:ABC transporter ATP-binding protein [Patescibacteria group bacterium]|nr:ABC transporter ATP-binding protein [Patescibacteria group bacterium]